MTYRKPLNRAKVLVVEDEPILAFYIKNLLSSAGAEVVGPATTVRRALELASAHDISCAFVDIHLHDGPVFPIARELERKGLGMVFYTGDATALEPIRRILPHAEIILKPAPVDALIKATAKVCALG
jgi:DNA-binding NarL/FixJ family response regulator